jgi:hypothetical protein
MQSKRKVGEASKEYVIAWEDTSLGESTVSVSHLLAASIVCCHIES